jgi:hypothetical protein
MTVDEHDDVNTHMGYKYRGRGDRQDSQRSLQAKCL